MLVHRERRKEPTLSCKVVSSNANVWPVFENGVVAARLFVGVSCRPYL